MTQKKRVKTHKLCGAITYDTYDTYIWLVYMIHKLIIQGIFVLRYIQDCTIFNNKEQQSTVVMLIDKKNTLRGKRVPEIEGSDCSGDDLATQYQRMIEMMQWIIEVKRVDLTAEVSILSSFRLPLCEEHVETAHQIYMYRRKSV